ncbi:MAG: hypothetical protein ABEJ30_01870 [Halorientalis sp.]
MPFQSLPGAPELIVLLLVTVLSLALYVALAVVAVRIALVFIDHPESVEIRNRVALLEHEVAELEATVEALESE